MARDNDLVLIGIGNEFTGYRQPTAEELEAYEASKKLEALNLDPAKIQQALTDKARLDELTT